jgi:hypothetical protein
LSYYGSVEVNSLEVKSRITFHVIDKQDMGLRANEFVLGEIGLIFFQTDTFNDMCCPLRAYIRLKVFFFLLILFYFSIFKMNKDQPLLCLLLRQ